MTTVFDRYHGLYTQLKEQEQAIAENKGLYQGSVQTAQAEIDRLQAEYESRLLTMDALETKLKHYAAQAQYYAHIDREACPPQKPDMGELEKCFNVISTRNYPDSIKKGYARQLLTQYYGAQKYIDRKKQQMSAELQEAQDALMSGGDVRQNRESIRLIEQQISGTILPQLTEALRRAVPVAQQYHVNTQEVYAPAVPEAPAGEMCLGYAEFPHTESDSGWEEMRAPELSSLRFDRYTHIPFGFPADGRNAENLYFANSIHICYNDETAANVHKIVQSITFNILRNYPPLCGRITYLDFGTFNDEYLNAMRCFTAENSLIQFPRHENQIKTCLSKLNAAAASEPESQRQRRFLIVKDASDHGKGGQFSDTISAIANNSAKNNIVLIYLRRLTDQKKPAVLPGQVLIHAVENQFFLSLPGCEYKFHWFHAPAGLTEAAVSIFQDKLIPKKVSNEYENFFPLHEPVNYVRDRRPIRLPYGMDHKGDIQYLKLEGMEFASFVMGASGSGKSTLLHALIAGVIRNYHPDEVELWLADLKLMEFANYTHHMPPHVKYILMDSSKEMVYDFIDLLHGEMERRQALLAAYGTNDCKNLPRDKYLPTLIVIIDEFSTMSDVIRDDDTYKRKLEQILVRGRGPGLRLIFSSQSYTDGAPALTKLAKGQIQTRIAMKNSPEEIKLTLDIPKEEMTDAISHEIATLPEHFALRCVQEKSGLHRVDKSHGLYFNGRDEEGWKSRFELIDRINRQMTPVSPGEFDPDRIDQYVEKKPIVVSSKALEAFNKDTFGRQVMLYKREPDNMVFDEDVLVRFGQPRKLVDNLFTVMTEEPSENIFLLAGNKEITCGMSVVMSAIRSFQHHGGGIQFWAHPRNRTYHWFKDSHLSAYPVHVGPESIRDAIDDLRTKIQKRQRGNELIVLLGMENICPDLNEATDDGFSVSLPMEMPVVQPLPVVVPQERKPDRDTEKLGNQILESLDDLDEMFDKFYDEQEAMGKSEEEIDEAWEKFRAEYSKAKYNITVKPVAKQPVQMPTTIPQKVRKDYLKDFQQLIRVGSRYGYHFLIFVSNLQSLKAMGLNINLFNHRLSFKTDSTDTSGAIFNNNTSAFRLAEHTCYYSAYGTSSGSYAITPYLHPGITWNNWTIDENGIARDGSRL